MAKTKLGLNLLSEYLKDTDKLRELAKDLCGYAVASELCGYPTDKGIMPDAARAALLLEAVADMVDSKDD